MFEAGYLVIHMALAVVTVWITHKYLSIFSRLRPVKTGVICLWILFYGYQVWIEGQKDIGFIWILLINITLQILIAVVGYEGSNLKKIFQMILLYIIWTLIEMFVYFILKLTPLNEQNFSVLGSVISKLVAVVLINILQIWFRRRQAERIPGYFLLLLILFPVSSVFIAYNIFILDAEYGHNVNSLISFSLLLLINLAIFEIYYKLSLTYSLEKDNSMFQQQIDLLTRHNEEQQYARDEISRMRHDMKNQLLVLRHEIQSEDTDKAVGAIDTMLDTTVNHAGYRIRSGNDLVDAILGSKCPLAEEKGICFHFNLYISEELPIQAGDLGILIGNALDNAIEATQQCRKNKEIQVSMGIRKQALIMAIQNPYEQGPVQNQNGQYVTTKEHKKDHGYGLKSIQKIVDKYDGDLDISTQDHIFSLIASLNLTK